MTLVHSDPQPEFAITGSGFTHDAAGNQTSDAFGGTLSYSAAGQMTAEAGYQNTSYTYAGTGQRELTHETVPGGATFDYPDSRADAYGDPLIDTIVHSGTSGPITVDYNAKGIPQVLTTSGGSENYYALDSLGDPIALTKTGGSQPVPTPSTRTATPPPDGSPSPITSPFSMTPATPTVRLRRRRSNQQCRSHGPVILVGSGPGGQLRIIVSGRSVAGEAIADATLVLDLTGIPEIVGPIVGCSAGVTMDAMDDGDLLDAIGASYS